MAKNVNLHKAKNARNDEFYTQYSDIESEINEFYKYNKNVFRGKTVLLPCDDPERSNFTKYFVINFDRLGLKKLISTSLASAAKATKYKFPVVKHHSAHLFELNNKKYATDKIDTHGKIFILTKKDDVSYVDIDNLEWSYLNGDGDFRSGEVTKLRDEADIIITNPPFSLFREFLAWIMEGEKQFMIIGNINCITYKEVFPLIKENKAWLGNGMGRWISGFIVPEQYKLYGTEARIEDGKRIVATNNCLWLTNIDHGRRHRPLELMTMADNLKYSKHKKIREKGYLKYANFDAIHIPFTDSIPSDYDGMMGVPITFLDKYCPEQFELIGNSSDLAEPIEVNGKMKMNPGRFYTITEEGLHREYDKIVIRRKK